MHFHILKLKIERNKLLLPKYFDILANNDKLTTNKNIDGSSEHLKQTGRAFITKSAKLKVLRQYFKAPRTSGLRTYLLRKEH